MKPDIYERIHEMLPVARQILADNGISDEPCEFSESIPAHEPPLMTKEQVEKFVEWTETTWVLGIAVGLLLNPALILRGRGGRKKGGVR